MLPKIELEVLITLSILHAREHVPDSSRPERSLIRPERELFNNVSVFTARVPESAGYQSSNCSERVLTCKARCSLALSSAPTPLTQAPLYRLRTAGPISDTRPL